MAAVRVRQQHQHQQVQQPITPPSPQPTIIRRKKPNQKFEKTMLLALVGIIIVLGVIVLNKQAAIQTTSIDIQNIESEAEEIAKQNVDLTVRVSELSTYENIWKKAKELGLTQNEKNVKVVPGE
ncbi:MAG TPA: cell division protein FtsL [Lysinibacillus sp.]|jgi:cell division protein FtsL|uniref:Cell division protein FtsL n=1 Tax=Lysinibacillus fusiformis TaxID=28031 RepID=A0A2I0V520_9BACI|nr:MULTISPECIES: cell division protein [Lysinibacillus]HBT71714.1 cell division protein FtsL [Lysinibacillus sp.]KUF36360.1 cell division protein [Lysinibacillus sp. F5]MEE3806902.1 cell division protein FtsL [Lysinibacillus fusiformis]PKU53378.1 cell division protein FtsL [Lysinibacillus fusiformis]WCH48664.1 cell division protein FtsL [Lysinibacillus sp. OF-1]